MRAGDWDAAWRQTDRIELPRRAAALHADFERDPSELVWDGSPFDARTVLVRCLHGLGDTLQFMRFVPQVHARARKLHFLVQPALLDLLVDLPGLGAVSNAWTDEPPACDVEIEVMELAYALRCTLETVPPPYPLACNPGAAAPLQLPDDGRIRVGMLWAASEWDTSRSVQLPHLADLFRTAGVAFYSLQQGSPAADAMVEQCGLVPLSHRTAAIADAAHAMMQMDLVISVDGMPAHLAATLGVPTWLMLKHECDWRWMCGRDDTPWYPAIRLFRQPRNGDWASVASNIANELRHFADATRTSRSAAAVLPTGAQRRAP
jgi:hypothetical protein